MPISTANTRANTRVKPDTKRRRYPRYMMKKTNNNPNNPPRGTMISPEYQKVVLIDAKHLAKLIKDEDGYIDQTRQNNSDGNVNAETDTIPGMPMYVSVVSEPPKINPGEEPRYRGRTWRLVAVILVLCISWFLVQMWSSVFDKFIKKVLKINTNKFLPNLILAIVMTVILISILVISDVDDMFHT